MAATREKVEYKGRVAYKYTKDDGSAVYVDPYSGGFLGEEPAPAAPKQETDVEAFYRQVYEGVMFELDELPPEARAKLATQIATMTTRDYNRDLASGTPPGVAQQKAFGAVDTQIREHAAVNKITPATQRGQNAANATGGLVNAADVGAGTDVYRNAVKDGKGVYDRILAKTGEPDPSAIKFFEENKVNGGIVNASTIGGPRELTGIRQEGTAVEATDLADLQASAKGQGSAQQIANARYRQMLQESAQTTNAQIQAQRGAERKGLRRAQLLAGGEQAMQAGAKILESDASTALKAQEQVANFQARKNEKQAELDAARRSGDANRIQLAEKDMAILEQEGQKFNATQTQEADKTNVANDIEVQGKNLATGMKAIEQDFNTWKGTNELAISAQKALEASAQGLLNEDQRQRALANAQRQLDLAERELNAMIARNETQDRRAAQQQKVSFWATTITSLLAIGASALGGSVGGPAGAVAGGAAGAAAGNAITGGATGSQGSEPNTVWAAHGGAVTKRTQAIIGEAGDHELVIPIKGKLSERMKRILAVEAEPFDAAGPKGEIDNMEDLTRAIRATLNTAPKHPGDDMTSMLAAATIRSRRAR